MYRTAVILSALVAVGALTWFFPLFHVVSRESQRAEREQKQFRVDGFVKEFWSARLMPALDDAADAATVLTALREDPQQARTQFGRSAGLGRSVLYFVRGQGTIVAVDDKHVGVALGGGHGADVALEAGLLFGNTVRDATGLLSGDDFPNSQQYNEISTELNRTIEATVLPSLREKAKVGATVQFVGCAEVSRVPRDIAPLRVVPVHVKFE